MGYGDPETPQEEIRIILEACDDLADNIRALSGCIHFFACGIHQKDYETFKNDVSIWLYETCGSITHHQSTIRNNIKRALELLDKIEKE